MSSFVFSKGKIAYVTGSLMIIFMIIFFAVPIIKHRNFVNFLRTVEHKPELRGSVIVVTARYEGEKENFFDYNGDKRIHPGSNFKLFTAAAALKNLGTDFTFKTRVYLNNSDLILVGGGDPSLKQADFAEFIDILKKRTGDFGDIYYDDNYFQGEKFGPGWSIDWRKEYFAVPITGLQIDDNLLNIRGGEIGSSGKFGIETKPLENYGKIVDNLTYFENPNLMKMPVTATMGDNSVIVLKGDTMKDLPFRTSATVKDPSLMTAMVFKQELVRAGLINNSAKVLPFSAGVKKENLIFEHKSSLLSDIVFQMLKFSKNNYAETLVRTLGNEVGADGSQEEGVIVLSDFSAEIGLDEGEMSAFDGSALSPSTRVTGNAVLKLFDFVNQQNWKDIFWNALPESQKDGTLKYRFETAGLKHQVIGKTGTHEFSSSLSGKILRNVDGGKNILFSIHVYNHSFTTEETVIKVRPLIDKIVALLDQQF